MGGRPEPRAPRRSRPSSSSFGWFSQASRLPSRRSEKGILTVACGSYIRACPPQPPPLASPPSSAGPPALSLPHTAVGLPPCSGLFHALLCCRALHSPCRSQLESFCSPAGAPHATPGCLPCSDSTMSRPAAISRPTSQLQVLVSQTGGLLVCLICSVPSPPRTPNFQLSAGRGRVNLVCPQPPTTPGRQSQEPWAEATQDDFPETNRGSPRPKPDPSRGGHGGGGRAADQECGAS